MADGPDIVRGPPRVVGVAGSEVELVCGENLRSNPATSVSWLDNRGNAVVGDSSNRVLSTSTSSSTSSAASGLVSLLLSNLVEEDAGNWTCTLAVEDVKTVVLAIALTVVGKSGTLLSVAISLCV